LYELRSGDCNGDLCNRVRQLQVDCIGNVYNGVRQLLVNQWLGKIQSGTGCKTTPRDEMITPTRPMTWKGPRWHWVSNHHIGDVDKWTTLRTVDKNRRLSMHSQLWKD
jgi:hypothetical protein